MKNTIGRFLTPSIVKWEKLKENKHSFSLRDDPRIYKGIGSGNALYKRKLYGAAYSAELFLLIESLRDSRFTDIHHADPFYLCPSEVKEAVKISGKVHYLGHFFNQWGHFLLETLPMLNHLIINSADKGIFLPLIPRASIINGNQIVNLSLLENLLKILNIEKERVIVNSSNRILESNFIIHSRPISIFNRIKDISPYRNVIKRIKKAAQQISNVDISPKIFLRRESKKGNKVKVASNKRVDNNIEVQIEDYFHKNGYSIITPAEYSFLDQVKIVSSAEYIVGFRGSHLHTSIFANNSSKTIELGDICSNQINKNQKICGIISESETKYCLYSDEVNIFLHRISNTIQ